MCDRDDNACGSCYACLEAFYFLPAPGLPAGLGFASRKPLAVGPGGGVLLRANKRAYLVKKTVAVDAPPTSWSDVRLAKLNLKGQALRMRLDVHNVGCACNAAAYLVNMRPENEVLPGSAKGVGPVYCDVQGPINTSVLHPATPQLCVEDDLVEANTKAFQSTLHTAFSKPGPGSGPNCADCDQWGWKSCGNGLGTFTARPLARPGPRWSNVIAGRRAIRA